MMCMHGVEHESLLRGQPTLNRGMLDWLSTNRHEEYSTIEKTTLQHQLRALPGTGFVAFSFPRSAWEGTPGRSAARTKPDRSQGVRALAPQSGEDGFPTQRAWEREKIHPST